MIFGGNNNYNAAELKSLFEKYPSVCLVYLFGSQVEESAGPASDFDFAIYINEKDTVKRSDILFALASDISKILQTDKIDAHSLSDLESPELKYQIIATGKVIFEREPFRILIEPRIMNEYFDFVYLLKKYNLTRAQ